MIHRRFYYLVVTLLIFVTAVPVFHTVAAPARQYEGVELAVLMVSQPAHQDCMQMVADDFSAETGASVEITAMGYGQLRDAILTGFVGQTGAFDIVEVAYQWTGEFADPGFLMPLDDFLANDNPEDLEDVIPRAMQLYGEWNGQQVALPYHAEAMLMFYRTDVLEEAGIEVPTTWEEYNAAVEQLTGDGFYGADIMGLREQALTMWSNRYWGRGGGSLDPDENGEINIDREIAIQALEDLKAHTLDYSPPGALNFGLPEAMAEFVAGNAAMVEMWPSFGGPMTLDSDATIPEVMDNVTVAQVPGGIPHSGGWGMSINVDTDNAEAAYTLIRRANSAEYDITCFLETGKGPVRLSTYDTLSADPDLEQYWLAELPIAIGNANPRSRAAQAGELNDMFDEVVARFLAGELSAEEAVDEMQSRIDSIIQ